MLVRLEAASVNARDWHIMRGEPRIARLMDRSIFGWRGPRVRVRGTDFAGVVEEVGPSVSDWTVGDRVFGQANATLAEYVVAPVSAMARVPAAVSMQQAAALPLAATTALECLRAADPRPGSTVLVNGASGAWARSPCRSRGSFGGAGDRRVQHEERGDGRVRSARTGSSTTPGRTSPGPGGRTT